MNYLFSNVQSLLLFYLKISQNISNFNEYINLLSVTVTPSDKRDRSIWSCAEQLLTLSLWDSWNHLPEDYLFINFTHFCVQLQELLNYVYCKIWCYIMTFKYLEYWERFQTRRRRLCLPTAALWKVCRWAFGRSKYRFAVMQTAENNQHLLFELKTTRRFFAWGQANRIPFVFGSNCLRLINGRLRVIR